LEKKILYASTIKTNGTPQKNPIPDTPTAPQTFT